LASLLPGFTPITMPPFLIPVSHQQRAPRNARAHQSTYQTTRHTGTGTSQRSSQRAGNDKAPSRRATEVPMAAMSANDSNQRCHQWPNLRQHLPWPCPSESGSIITEVRLTGFCPTCEQVHRSCL
jgi:hypothetical protein